MAKISTQQKDLDSFLQDINSLKKEMERYCKHMKAVNTGDEIYVDYFQLNRIINYVEAHLSDLKRLTKACEILTPPLHNQHS